MTSCDGCLGNTNKDRISTEIGRQESKFNVYYILGLGPGICNVLVHLITKHYRVNIIVLSTLFLTVRLIDTKILQRGKTAVRIIQAGSSHLKYV